MQLPIEIAQRPNLQIRSHAGSTKSAVPWNAAAEMQWGFIGENDHQVIIAVRAGIPARGGAKEVNPFGAIHFD